MIRSNSINLDDLDSYAIPPSPRSREAVRTLLADEDRYTQLKGLELAAQMNQPAAFLTEVEALVPEADAQVYGKAIAIFSDCPDLLEHFEGQLQNPDLQGFAIEVLLNNRYRPGPEQIATWLHSPQQELQVLGAMAQTLADPDCDLAWPSELSSTTARTIARVVAYSNAQALSSLIPDVILMQSGPEVIQAGLEALRTLAQRGDRSVAALATAKLDHPEPIVRIAAFDVLRVTVCGEYLPAVGDGLRDADPRVRQQVSETLAAYGDAGVAVAQEHLAGSSIETVNTAIVAIGLVRTRSASNVLFDYLAPSYRQLARTRNWQQQIPSDDPSWQSLGVAIADFHDRLIQKVLFVLSALGHSRTVNTVNRLLAMGDRAELEKAFEVLNSLPHRRFVLPLMPLLEEMKGGSQPSVNGVEATPQWLRSTGYHMLLEALESEDRWLRTGALIALSTVPSELVSDPDPFVRRVAGQIFGTVAPQSSTANTAMSRLLLLNNVPLFKNLTLDELLSIDEHLEQTQSLAGETIFSEGDWGTHLYIIADGSVRLIKDIGGTPREFKLLEQGQYFGEVALFDDAPRWDGAIAVSDCTLLKLGKSHFLSLIAQRPHIILEICRFLSQRLRETDKHHSPQALSVSEDSSEPATDSQALSTEV